jgi:peptide/nickel transport system ATP-binding protein
VSVLEPNGAAGNHASVARDTPGPVVMEAIGLCKDFRLSHGQVLSAVRGVSLSLYRGGVVALVGESGSGKSTVAKLLAGQEKPSAGTVRLEGRPVVVSNRRSFRLYKSEVQYVFQDPFGSLNPVHTVRHHLERPLRLHVRAPKSKLEARLLELMNQVRLTPAEQFLSMYPHELSGGQRQRVSFARALAAGPKVLLADEPVSMLDVSIRLDMLNLLDDLRRRLELALLYITHDIASARYFADEALVMYAGQIVERGPAEQLTQSPAHPYTQLLVASAPDPEDLGGSLRRGPKLAGRGQVAAASPATVGCSFSSRCPFADERCRTRAPDLVNIGPTRAAACWHLDVAARALASQSKGVRADQNV